MKDFLPSMRVDRLSMRAERLSLRANFSWAFVGNTVYNASRWGLIIVLAKLGSPELVGRYTLALAVTAPVFMFTSLRLITVLTTDMQDRNAFGDYLGLRLLCSLLGIVVIAGILRIGGYEEGLVGIVTLVSLSKFAESISDVTYGLMQKQERLDLVARSLMLRGLLSLAAMTVIMYSLRNLAAALAAQVIVWAGVLWVFDLPNARRWQPTRPQFDRRILIGLFWLALPLSIVAGLNNLSAQAPRYAMEHFWGERELGIYAAIASLGLYARLVTMALSRSALPRLSRFYAQDDFGQFMRLLLRLMGIGATVGALGIMGAALFGKPFLTIVYTEEYAAYTDVLMAVMASVGVVAAFTFLGTAVAATQQFAVQALVHVAKLTAIGIACYMLVPRWGALGAAWAVLIGALVSSPAYFFILWRTMRQTKRGPIHEV